MQRGSTQVWLAAALWLAAGTAVGDVIYFKDGTRQEGMITLDRADLPTLSIRTASGEIAVQRTRIDHVDRESKAMSLARLGQQYLAKRNYKEATSALRASVELDKTNADAAAKLAEAEAGLATAQEAARKEQLASVASGIEKALLLTKEKKFDEAAQVLRSADPGDDSPKTAEYRAAYGQVYAAWGLDRADRQDFSGAAEKLQMALKMDPDNQEARSKLAIVWENDPTKVKELAAYYRNSTAPGDQLKLADAYFKMKNYEAALPIYVKLASDPAFLTPAITDRLRLMYDTMHRQYASSGDFEKAIDTFKAFLQLFPNEDRTPLAKYEFMLVRAKTDLNDPAARVKLARFAEDRGLLDTAKQEYINILQMAPNNEQARAGMKRFAAADLEDANAFFAEQQYLLARSKAQDIVKQYKMFPDIVRDANQLQAKAEVEQEKLARTMQQQAVALALRGDDYYNQAQSYLSAMVSTNVERSKRVFSPKIEATRNMQRAIYAWQTALSIDPTLGDPTTYDLRRKIADAYQRYIVLANPVAPPLPRMEISPTTNP